MSIEDWGIAPDENSETGLVERRLRRHAHRSAGKPWTLKIASPHIFKTGPKAASESPGSQSGIDLSFQDLSYSVKQGIRRERKEILQGLYGEFRAGELTAIMGPSGSGKSTLLNALAGYTTLGVTGTFHVNGELRNLRTFRQRSCYILQDDVLPEMLTVEEAIAIAIKLKIGPRTPDAGKRTIEILTALGISESRHVMTCNLSGGQRKRLAIALELISNPPVMFFDEPTSGLDSSTSKQCIRLLKEMAMEGRTMVCSIHQPSATLFEMFDHVYVVREGQCVYSGSSSSLVPFLEEVQLPCPQYHNPADFILEIVSMDEYCHLVPRLVKAVDEGKNTRWRKNCTLLQSANIESEKASLSSAESSKSWTSSQSSNKGNYAASFWTQFSTITCRYFLQLYRKKFHTYLRLLIHVSIGVLNGVLFYDIGNSASSSRDIFSLFFFSIMFIMFTAYSAAVTFYPLRIPIITREHFNKWYSLKSYYLAANLSEVPVQLLCSTLYFSIVYFMSSQPLELHRFLISTFTIALVGLVGQSLGYVIGCSMRISNAAIFGPFCMSPFIIFSGFFVLLNDSPWFLGWLYHLSYFKYALHSIMQAIFGFNRPRFICNQDYCHFRVPHKFLKDVGMNDGDYRFDWAIIISTILLLRFFAFYFLTIQIRFLRK